jgi:predicted regulator of Ras-like GTPase activity (Roadblock/LC7/MglB family)
LPTIEDSLRTLRDVEGVFGSFVVTGSGALVSKDLPSVFDDDVLSEVGPRIARLYETFASGGDELDSVMLRYFEHKLYVRKMTWGLLGILSGVQVNLPALRMVGNLVARKIDPEVAATVSRSPAMARTPSPPKTAPAKTASTPPPLPVVPATPSTPPEIRDSAPPMSERTVRMYRGRRIEE